MMSQLWRSTREGRMPALDKYQLLLTFAGHAALDPGAQPYQAANFVVQIRNVIAHYRPEDLAADVQHALEKKLRGRFADNRLMAGAGNPWWPDHCLGAGCAAWATDSVEAFADHVMYEIGLHPNYARLRKGDWEGIGGSPDARFANFVRRRRLLRAALTASCLRPSALSTTCSASAATASLFPARSASRFVGQDEGTMTRALMTFIQPPLRFGAVMISARFRRLRSSLSCATERRSASIKSTTCAPTKLVGASAGSWPLCRRDGSISSAS